jgi:hypothetical protein
MDNQNNNVSESPLIEQQPKIKKRLPKWVTVVGILIIIIVAWLGIEVVNYSEYVSARNNYYDNPQQFMCWGCDTMPTYRPAIMQAFYAIFPSMDPQVQERDWAQPAKPVIYLYPTSTEKVKVQLDYKGIITADYPPYNFEQKGWTVTATPDGKIIGEDGKEYSYLFWEGQSLTPVNYDLSTGFIVRGEDTREFLQTTLAKMGLTPKEYNEFIVYWYPKMKDNKYNLIHFAESEYTDTALLTITPKPDSMLRVFMVFKPLDNTINIKPQEIESFVRNGFTVVEWGGDEINN